MQANIPPSTPAEEWPLEPLVAKLRQYCYLLADLTPEGLAAEAAGDYDKMRSYLRWVLLCALRVLWSPARASSLAQVVCGWWKPG